MDGIVGYNHGRHHLLTGFNTMKLEFDSIVLEFGMHRVLSSIHGSCETGQVVGLLGRNGSGKTCLMKIVSGRMNATSKSTRTNGEYLNQNKLLQKISYLPQGDLLPDFITFAEAMKLYKVSDEKMETIFPDFKEFKHRKSAEVSGGQRRMFEVLLVLFASHPFCLLDEPFSGLMPIHVELLCQVIQAEKANKGILLSDHLHRQVRQVADKLYVLTNGNTHVIKSEEQLVSLGYLTEGHITSAH